MENITSKKDWYKPETSKKLPSILKDIYDKIEIIDKRLTILEKK